MQTLKTKKKFRLIIGLFLVLLTAGLVYGGLQWQAANRTDSIATPINYAPPSKNDREAVEANKKEIAEREAKLEQTTTTSQKRTLQPIITYADQYDDVVEVGGYIAVFEEGGTCTATFKKGSVTITRSVAAVRGANSTDCPVITINTQEFNPKGLYTVTLSYDSPTTTGSTSPKEIEVK